MSVREELLKFLSYGRSKITKDGEIILYKYVSHDYKDCYTGTFDNSIGATVQMKRNDVNTDRKQTCSAGLHLCSYDYIKDMGNSTYKIVACLVKPEDVVSIPEDYKNTKMRCCKYKVIADITNEIQDDVLTDIIKVDKILQEAETKKII